jgi:hypothetical protein
MNNWKVVFTDELEEVYIRQRNAYIDYLNLKVIEGDWHGVSDAANDLRVLEAKHERKNDDRS